MIEKIEDPESSRFGEKGSRKPNKRKYGSNEWWKVLVCRQRYLIFT